ncbi:MAG TPA: V-type ATPase subunit [Rectinemataceae bacterium]|nr:V-type ATPase subunit [Rectinemataceae bacterium]
MADSFEIAYLYARVCGAFSSMYLGAKGAALAAESSLSSIWRLYFEEDIPNRPEPWLLATLERKVIGHSMERFMTLAGPAMESDKFITAIVAKYEISVIKNLLYKLTAMEPRPETQFFSSPIIERALSAWPRVEDMFADSPYAWIEAADLADIGTVENRLDRQYYRQLWDAASALPGNRKGNIPALVLRDIQYQNLAWALRVRRYYGYGREMTAPLLVEIEGEDAVSLALESFDLDIGTLGGFDEWPVKKLLEGQTAPYLDLPLLENRMQRELFAFVRRSMHMYPFGYTPLYCYFKMLEAEASFVLGILEGIRLKAPAEEKIGLAWALAGDNT